MMNKKPQKQQSGLSLIELLIAMLIGVLLLTGAMGLFISNKRVYKELNERGRLQENARFAIEMLTNDIRMAGYAGCVNDVTSLTNETKSAVDDKHLHNYSNAVEGINKKESRSRWSPSDSADEIAEIKADTDAITLRYLEPIPTQVKYTPGSTMTKTSIPITCTSKNCPSDITANENMAITDCSTGHIFTVKDRTTDTIIPEKEIDKIYDSKSAQISRYITTRYYISDTALWRYTSVNGTPTSQELLKGVERMEILYGVDTNDDSVPDSYLPKRSAGLDKIGDWSNVVSIKIALLLKTINENFHIDKDTNSYELLNAEAYDPVDDYIQRRVFTTTVQIRNRVPKS